MSRSIRKTTAFAFTLVELLVVMALLALLMTIAVPGTNRVLNANRLTVTGSKVAHMAGLARQLAMAENTLTALVLLGPLGTEEDFRAMAVAKYQRESGWALTGPWESLPPGIVVDQKESTFLQNSPAKLPLYGADETTAPKLDFRGTEVGDKFAARIFLPGGSLQNADKAAQIRLVEGEVDGSGTNYARQDSGGKPLSTLDVILIGGTGAVSIIRN